MSRLPGIEGCTDHGCVFGHPGGMGTNGGCGCEREIRSPEMRRRMRKNVQLYRERIAELDRYNTNLAQESHELRETIRRMEPLIVAASSVLAVWDTRAGPFVGMHEDPRMQGAIETLREALK